MNKERVLIKRESPFLRCWFLDNKQIEKIVFYNKGLILYESSCSWLQDELKNQDLTQLEIYKPVRAIKKDLNRKDNFYINEIPFNWKSEKGLVLYINTEFEGLNFEEPFIIDYYNNDYEIKTRKLIKLKGIKGLIYYPYLDDNKKLQYKEIETKEAVLFIEVITELTKRGLERDSLRDAFKEAGLEKISLYEIEKILDKYNIILTKKEEVLKDELRKS